MSVGSGPARHRALLEAALAALANGIGILVYGGFRTDRLALPLSYEGDALHYQAIIKAIVDTGWYFEIPRLGAPFATLHLDFPVPDLGALLVIKVLGLFATEPATVFNLLFVSSFFLVPFAAYLAARRLSVSGPASLVIATTFNLLPFHFYRLGHLFYTLYFTVPVYVYVAIKLLSGESALGERARFWRRSAALAVAATFGLYNAIFGFALLFFVGVYLWFEHRRASLEAFALAALVIASLLACLSPNIVHRIAHGTNVEAAQRPAADSEVYALRATLLTIPMPDHRFAPFARAGERFGSQAPLVNENRTSWLGVLGIAGFALSLAAALGLALRGPAAKTLRGASRANAFLFLFGTMGGLGALFNYLVWPQIRAYNRISVFIAYLSLLVLALAMSKRWDWMRAGNRAAWIAAGAISLAAAADLVTAPDVFSRMADRFAARFESDRAFARELERSLPRGSMVFQLPHQRFPESPPIHGVGSYDGFYPYLHTEALRFSFGAMRSRPEADWQDEIARLRPAPLARALEQHGFSAILLDRHGYADGGQALRQALAASGVAILRENPDYIAFALKPSTTPLAPKLREFAWSMASGFHRLEHWADGVGAWCRSPCTLELQRTRSRWKESSDGPATVELSVQAYGERSVSVVIDGETTRVLRPGVSNAVVRLKIPAGVSKVSVRLESDLPPVVAGRGDQRLIAFRVFDIRS